VTVLIAVASLLYAKRADDRSAASEAELHRIDFQIVTATSSVLSQFRASFAGGPTKAKLAVSVAMENASLRGLIVRDAQLRLDNRKVACAVGWVSPAEFRKMRFTDNRSRNIAQPLPLAVPERAAVTAVLLFVAAERYLFPACAATPRFWRLAKGDMVQLARRAGQRSLRLRLDLVPGGWKSIPVDFVFTTPDLTLGPDPNLGDAVGTAPAAPAEAVPVAPAAPHEVNEPPAAPPAPEP
jgi:hypothetical protein